MSKTHVLVIGIGGASCSGKTLLAKHLVSLLPPSTCPALLHEDDFAPPEDLVPVHPVHGVQDWDDPDTAIEWPRLRAALEVIHATGALPDGHRSLDHLNKQVEVPVADEVAERCRERIGEAVLKVQRVERSGEGGGEEGVNVKIVVVDGFLLYYDPEVASLLDVKVLVRVPYAQLKSRREKRATYALQHPDSEGIVWTDPPNYFDNIVYPAYVKAHTSLFDTGDVEGGSVRPESGVLDIAATEGPVGMADALERVCEAVVRALGA